jgi:hypothetical protein
VVLAVETRQSSLPSPALISLPHPMTFPVASVSSDKRMYLGELEL